MAETPIIPMGNDADSSGAAEAIIPSSPRRAAARLWQRGSGLSSFAAITGAAIDWTERALAEAGFDRAPWLAVVFGSGVFAWFALKCFTKVSP